MIGVFDSGVGGLSVWREIARQLPHQGIVYLADQAHVPYGSRRLAEVLAFSEGITRFLLRQRAEVIVIACNTASAAALHYLRRTFPTVPFVGMEPAVKPAVERTRTNVVGVMATQATFQGELFASLVERYADHVHVLTQVCPGLVEAVEAGALDTPETEALLRQYLTPLIEAGADQLALGCTHYLFLRPVIERVVGTHMAVIDPAPAVARQTGRVLARQGSRTNPSTSPGYRPATDAVPDRSHASRYVFYTSGDAAAFAAMIERLLPSFGRAADVQTARWRGRSLIEPCEGLQPSQGSPS